MAKRDPLGPNIELVRIPFIGVPLNRDTSTKDQRYVNVVFEKVTNPITNNNRIFVPKRAGLAASTRPPNANATGRGVYQWSENGNIYSVFDNKIYSGTTDLGVTLAGSSGRCWFAETGPTSSVRRLCISDGTKLYLISSADAVTTVSTSSDAQFPTANLGPVIFFNTYLYFALVNGTIWNSDVDAPTSYSATAFKTAEGYPDKLVTFFRQKDQLVFLGEFSGEFFYDNNNPIGSPLQRIDQNVMEIGCASGNSLQNAEGVAVWVSTSKNGGYSIWRMDDLSKTARISNEQIEKILVAEGSSITSCTSFILRAHGQFLYGLNLSTANRTLMYDIQQNLWFEWADASGNKFNCISATEKNGVVYLQDAANGRIYTYSASTFQDNSANFTVTIQTGAYDFDSGDLKTNPVLDVEADNTTGNLSVSWADDDYVTFSSARTIDLSGSKKRLTRCGPMFRKRAWKLTYADNYALRLEAMKLKLRRGCK